MKSFDGNKDFQRIKSEDDYNCFPTNNIKSYDCKVIFSGNIVEIYQYEKHINYDYSKKKKLQETKKEIDLNNIDCGLTYNKELDLEYEKPGKRIDNIYRARRDIRRLIWSNINPFSKFFTLTYAKNQQDYNEMMLHIKIFHQKLKKFNIKLSYLYVVEKQKRGAYHLHMVIFNNEYIDWKILNRCWEHGTIEIKKIKNVKNLGAYVCKYLTKETLELMDKKSYHVSRNLFRPIEKKIKTSDIAEYLKSLNLDYSLIYTNTYEVGFVDKSNINNSIITNNVIYTQYKLLK